jgi:hypothetical protein
MATTRELIESRPTTWERSGIRTGVMVFYADVPPDIVRTDPVTSGPAIPVPRFSSFPGDPECICDFVRADYWPGSVHESRVTATFTTAVNISVLPQDPEYTSWAMGTRIMRQRIPYASVDEQGYEYQDENGTRQFVKQWVANETTNEETRRYVIKRVNLEDFDPIVLAPIIEQQSNTLHVIGGETFLFNGVQANQISENLWSLEYTWEKDSGTPDVSPIFDPGNGLMAWWPRRLASSITNANIPGLWMRPPYHEIAINGWEELDPAYPWAPSWYAQPLKACPNPNGYLSLPGWH